MATIFAIETRNAQRILINADFIGKVEPMREGCRILMTGDISNVDVAHSVDEIYKMIAEAEMAIVKQGRR